MSSLPASRVLYITNKKSYDAAAEQARAGTPTVMFVSHAPMPSCVALQPKFEDLAKHHPDKTFVVVEMTSEITPMIKFGVQQCPILILMKGESCETILGGDLRKLGDRLKGM